MKVNQASKLILVALVGVMSLTSCNKYVADRNKEIETTLEMIEESLEHARIPDSPLITDTVVAKNDIWLGNQSIKITEGDPLPMWAEKDDGIIISISEEASLPLLAQEITDLTGISVRLDDLKASNSVPTETVPVNYSGKLSGLLNYMSNRYGVWWKYKGGVITFFQQETRVFTVYALPTESSMNTSLQGSTMGSGSGGGSSSNTMQTSASTSAWDSIENGIKQVLGQEGEVSFSRQFGTVTITAAPFTMRRVATYINNWNEKMSRQVAISVKVLIVSIQDSNKYGLDLNAVYKGSKKIAGTLISPVTGFDPTLGGTLSMALIDPKSNWNGSDAMIEALSTQGKTSVVTTSSVTTLNNKIAPIQVTTSKKYVSETRVTNTGSGSDNTTETEIDTDTLNYGFTMEILPRILDHGRLIMLFSLNLTELISLEEYTTGSKSSEESSSSGTDTSSAEKVDSTTVQLPTMQTRGFIQEIAMRSGSTLVLTGFENVRRSTDTAGIGQPRLTILGGKANDSKERDVMVVMVTPEVLESPLSAESRMNNF